MNKPCCILSATAAICVVAASAAQAGSLAPAKTAHDFNNPHKGFMLWGTDYADGAPANHYRATVFHIYTP